ncbi:MAG TPA: FUSC family protein [Mycobacteriales bacterium]|nr:FUSC family protein [Mycobacteriales bacterium]
MKPAGEIRAAVLGALAIDRTGFEPVIALRAAAGVVIPYAVGAAVGHPTEGSIAAAGALPAGVAAFGGGFRSRANTMIAAGVGMAISTFVGGIVAGHFAATTMVLIVSGFAAGIVVVLGREATIVGTQAVMGLVVFGRFPGSVASSGVHAGWVLAGGGFQGVLAAAIRPPERFVSERRTLAAAYSELADLALNPSRSSITTASEAASAGALIGRRTPSEDIELLRGLADEADRIRLELHALATVPDIEMVEAVRRAAADWLRGSSQALRDGAAARPERPELATEVDTLRARLDPRPRSRRATHERYAAARSSALLGQLRAVDRLVSALAGVRRLVLPRAIGSPAVMMLPQRLADSARRLATTARDWKSAAFRHALRLAVILPVAEALSHVLPWQRGYWVTLTALVVLKPDYAATVQRGIGRVGGTGLGVVLSGLLIVAIHPSGAVLSVLLAIATWAAYTSFAASYALYSFAVTAVVVLLLTTLGGNELTTVADRGLDTLVGGALALVGYAVWPTWERETLSTSTNRLLSALADYADVLLAAYIDPESVDRSEVGAAATTARRARIAAQASLNRAIAEPARAGADTDSAAGILATGRRIVIALHALRATIDDATEHTAVPEVADIRDAIVTALRQLSAGRPAAVSGLRDRQQDLETDIGDDPGSLRARRRALVAAHLDPLVDSIDTLAHVMNS